MTEERTTKREILIPDETEGTHITTEYGIRYPDGRKKWQVFESFNGVSYSVASIIPGTNVPFSTNAENYWRRTLAKKAEAANIPLDEYVDEHEFIKRTVILVTTKSEKV